jgi:hypothetical protein
MKKVVLAAIGVFAILLIGFLLPIGTYTTTKGCPTDPTPTERLHLILGDSIEDIKSGDKIQSRPEVGCSANTKYTLYIL